MSKDELRTKLSEMYKASKDQVSVFGFRTQYGGGKSTGFALIYDSNEAMKKFEPHYRLVRYGQATKIEKASRQQRALGPLMEMLSRRLTDIHRQAAQEPCQDHARYGQGQGPDQGQEEISGLTGWWWCCGRRIWALGVYVSTVSTGTACSGVLGKAGIFETDVCRELAFCNQEFEQIFCNKPSLAMRDE